MSSVLPINLDDVLLLRGVESSRVEFKASWDPLTTGAQVIRTICAFANDFQNLNGGYIVLGVEELEGRAILPPRGLSATKLAESQKWIRGRCNTIDPVYQPILAPELYQDRAILVIWAPGSDTRPHQAPENQERGSDRHFYIRLGNESVDADRYPDLETQLLQMTARVPFDDRRALQASVLDLRETKVREFLHDIGSGLVEETDTKTLYRNLRIAVPVNGHDVPKNVGLLFFSQDPEQWFPGARIEVAQFADDASGNVIEEKLFSKMPAHEQLRECISYLEHLTARLIQKSPHSIDATHWVSYPLIALREALVNAVYHRAYEGTSEPIKVYLYPNRMEIISYPGPVPGIERSQLNGSSPLPPVPARNRRIGEFLKELKLAEGRGTGLPKVRRAMEQNGSPPPVFDFDEGRTYFRVTLPAHPEYKAILALQDIAKLKAVGDVSGAFQRLKNAFRTSSGSIELAAELVREHLAINDLPAAIEVYEGCARSRPGISVSPLITRIASYLLDCKRNDEARAWLDNLRDVKAVDEAVEAAILEKRAGRLQNAHRYFSLAGSAIMGDARALHEFAQVKIKLAEMSRSRGDASAAACRGLLDEASEMLIRVTQMDAPRARRAWAWSDLGHVGKLRGSPIAEVRGAYEEAIRLEPMEPRFKEWLDRIE